MHECDVTNSSKDNLKVITSLNKIPFPTQAPLTASNRVGRHEPHRHPGENVDRQV